MDKKLRPVISIRIFRETKCFGPGVAELLRHVREAHSLRGAAMTMGMAYSKAWTIVKQAERELGFPLLVSVTGGRHGGGAELSPKAERPMGTTAPGCGPLPPRNSAARLRNSRRSRRRNRNKESK
jgi:molybdate transport system regulatory protein